MKKIMVVLITLIFVTGCQGAAKPDAKEKSEHNSKVVLSNQIEGNVYRNDFVGIQLDLKEDGIIYDYDELDLPEDELEAGNILLSASLNDSDVLLVVESLYEGDNYKDEFVESIQSYDNEVGTTSVYSEEQIKIKDEDVLLIKLEQDFGENRKAYFNYYFIHHKESLITMMITYDGEMKTDTLEEFLSWTKFY